MPSFVYTEAREKFVAAEMAQPGAEGSDTFYLEQVTLEESDDDFEYEAVADESDEEDDADEGASTSNSSLYPHPASHVTACHPRARRSPCGTTR